MLTFGSREILLELSSLAGGFEAALDFTLERFQQSRDGDQYGYPFASDRFQQIAGIESFKKDGGSAEQRRDENRKQLAENMAQREEIEKSQRMENTLVAQVLLHFMFDRFDIGKNVGMGDHHTAGLGGGSRREDNLQRVVARKLRRSIGSSGVCCDRLAQRFELQHGNGDAGRQERRESTPRAWR